MSNVIIENEQAYENGTKARIIGNARKTFARSCAKHAVLLDIINCGGYYLGDDADGRVIMSHPLGRLPSFIHKMNESLDKYGKLTPRQVDACFEVLANVQQKRADFKRQNEEAIQQQIATSKYVGAEGDKMTLDLTCKHISEVHGPSFSKYDTGVQSWFTMEDPLGNQLRYKGRADFLAKGQTGTVSFTIKRHYIDGKGVACTVISRPKTTFIYLNQAKD